MDLEFDVLQFADKIALSGVVGIGAGQKFDPRKEKTRSVGLVLVVEQSNRAITWSVRRRLNQEFVG